jgi:poly(3-hydroxybutyrate) depolymerase
MGATVQLWVGSKRGPLYIYWHGTGDNNAEVAQGLPGVTASVSSEGGMVVSFETSTGQGTDTNGAVWFTGDFVVVDQLVACGVAQGYVDARRIHMVGYSAGGLQTAAMVFARSSYLASAFVYSGGLEEFPATDAGPAVTGTLQDPTNVPSVGFGHGAKGSDWLIVDFADLAHATTTRLRSLGGFTFECDDGGSHIDFFTTRSAALGSSVVQFLKDHPYKTRPSPYENGLPSGWPSYCAITR